MCCEKTIKGKWNITHFIPAGRCEIIGDGVGDGAVVVRKEEERRGKSWNR
jgi:hypothetical protein